MHEKNRVRGDMEQKEMRMLFEAGDLKKCHCTKAPMQSGWVLQFDSKSMKRVVPLHSKHKGSARIFASIDTAVSVAYRIGFKTVTVNQ